MPGAPQSAAEIIPPEIRFDRRVQNMAHIKEDGKYPHRTDSAADPRSEAAPLLPGFPPQRRKRTADQADEQPHRSRGGKLVGRRDAPRQSQKARCPADSQWQKNMPVLKKSPLRMRQSLYQRRYTSKITASTPPDTPGSMAPAPISAPQRKSRRKRVRSSLFKLLTVPHRLIVAVFSAGFNEQPMNKSEFFFASSCL